MRIGKGLRRCVIAACCASLLGGQFAHSAVPNSVPAAGVHDVALRPSGLLTGQVFDAQGAPQAGVPVRIRNRAGEPVAAVTTDPRGRFQVQGLRAGVYDISSTNGGGAYRLWAPHTAPPVAGDGALIVNNGTVARGQLGLLGNPWALGLIVAAAIAIPLAADDDDDAS